MVRANMRGKFMGVNLKAFNADSLFETNHEGLAVKELRSPPPY